MRLALLPVCLLALMACAQPRAFTGDPSVAELTRDQVAECTPLKKITTTTGVFGSIGRERAIELARNETRNKAASDGATAIVYVSGGPDDPDALYVEALTYRC